VVAFEKCQGKKWLQLLKSQEDCAWVSDSIYSIEEWKSVCTESGYRTTEVKQIYEELPAPEGNVFPFENEIMQWMGEYLCISCK